MNLTTEKRYAILLQNYGLSVKGVAPDPAGITKGLPLLSAAVTGCIMINVAIVEDEKNAADLLLSYFNTYTEKKGEKFHVVWFDNPVNFLTYYKPNYDLVLMDIELPDINGMDTSRKLRKIDKTVTLIFVTNMSQFAVTGYEVDAFDYIVKPVSYYDFALKLERALERIKSRTELKIQVVVDDVIKCITSSELKYVEVINHKLIFHTKDGDYVGNGTLKDFEKKLQTADFARCNNCYLVNLRYVTGISGYTVTVDGDELQISHPKRKDFKRALNDYLGEKL